MRSFMKSLVVRILTLEARLLLSRKKPRIIAVTGSVGKTTTKDAIYAVLKGYHSARKSEKSYNSDIGVPLSILGLPNAWNNPFRWVKNLIDGFFIACCSRHYPEVLVLEMGVDRPGDMKKLSSWIRPNVVVLTRLPEVPVHVEYFSTPEAVIAEKMTLVEALKPSGVLVFNNDDERVRIEASNVRQKTVGYSRYSVSQFQASGDEIMYDGSIPVGMSFELTHVSDTVQVRVLGSLGIPHIYSYTAAAAVGALFDVTLPQAAAALREHIPPPGRMRILPGIKDTVLLDDTYNASPVATERALSTLRELQGFVRRIAVLGDMLELGQFSVREHERVGEQVAETADMLVTVGVRARSIAQGALAFGMSENSILQYDDSEHASKELQTLIHPGDVLLIKGSQGIRCERIVEELMAEPERAEELLVRQGHVWRSIL